MGSATTTIIWILCGGILLVLPKNKASFWASCVAQQEPHCRDLKWGTIALGNETMCLWKKVT